MGTGFIKCIPITLSGRFVIAAIKTIEKEFEKIEFLYIADGHHRSASSNLLAENLKKSSKNHSGSEPYNFFMSYLIPESENELDAVAEFERKFELEIYQSSLRSFSKMFSFATTIGITKLTAYEVRNLAAIAYAVVQNIPTETTMSKLILEEE